MRPTSSQRGGTFLGFILGLVLGLGVALAVAIYVTKVPTPFSSKNQPRSSEQDVVETQKNKDWNPNGVLQPKSPAAAEAPGAVTPAPAPAATPAVPTTPPATPSAPAKPEPKAPAVQADPLGDLARTKAAATPAPNAASDEPFQYFIQVGAYRAASEADAQKARMAMMGLDAKVSEREQGGRIVFRVRLGPYDDKAVAERVRAKLESSQIDNTLVRIQR